MSGDYFTRRYVFKLYPTKGQAAKLEHALRLHCALYNAALEERIGHYRYAKRQIEIFGNEDIKLGLSHFDQDLALKEIRAALPDYKKLNADSLSRTLKRQDEAFKNFFGRVKKGQTPGFPKFRSWKRFSGFSYREPQKSNRYGSGRGWSYQQTGSKTGWLKLKDLDIRIKARGNFPKRPDEFRTMDLTQDSSGIWFASFVVCYQETDKKAGQNSCGIDLGIEKFAAIAHPDGSHTIIENERFTKSSKQEVEKACQELSSKKRGSNNRKRARLRLSRLKRKDANRRKHFAHVQSTRIVLEYGLIATEELSLANMTRSAKGTIDNPGKNVKQKAALNREMLDIGAAQFLDMLEYKAIEAGSEFIKIPTQKVKPSQTCPECGAVEKKNLSDRVHYCKRCGCTEDRDVAAARVMLNYALNNLDKEVA